MDIRSPDTLARQVFLIVVTGVIAFIAAAMAVLLFSTAAG